MERCVGLWGSPGTGYCAFVGLWSLLWKYLDWRNEAAKHLVLHWNWPIYPGTLIVQNYLPRWRALSPVFSPGDKPGNLKKARGGPGGLLLIFSANGKKVSWTNDGGPWWWSGQGASGRVVSLVFLYLCHSVFDWLHSHRFLYLPVKPPAFIRGGSGGAPPPPHSLPLPAHSALSRWHLLPTHLHCVPIMHTDSKSFVWADTHTHTLTQINSHKLVL